MPAVLEKPADTQINVRIAHSLKEAGDTVLRQAGLSPTQAVRALWELAARNADSPEAVTHALFPEAAQLKEKGEEEAKSRRARLISQGPRISRQVFEELGISLSYEADSPSYDDLKEEVLAERYGESMGWS